MKVYLGHVLLQSVLFFFFFKYYFHLLFLTSWKTLAKNRECILLHHHMLSAFHCIFQLKTWDSNTVPTAGPFLGDSTGPAAWRIMMPLKSQPSLLPKGAFP